MIRYHVRRAICWLVGHRLVVFMAGEGSLVYCQRCHVNFGWQHRDKTVTTK